MLLHAGLDPKRTTLREVAAFLEIAEERAEAAENQRQDVAAQPTPPHGHQY